MIQSGTPALTEPCLPKTIVTDRLHAPVQPLPRPGASLSLFVRSCRYVQGCQGRLTGRSEDIVTDLLKYGTRYPSVPSPQPPTPSQPPQCRMTKNSTPPTQTSSYELWVPPSAISEFTNSSYPSPHPCSRTCFPFPNKPQTSRESRVQRSWKSSKSRTPPTR